MKGISYLIDEAGKKTAVVIDLKKMANFWEDFYDAYIVDKRVSEPRISLYEAEKSLKKAGKLLKK